MCWLSQVGGLRVLLCVPMALPRRPRGSLPRPMGSEHLNLIATLFEGFGLPVDLLHGALP